MIDTFEVGMRSIREGFAVFACGKNSKKPATRRGFYDATRDPDALAGMIGTASGCNIAISLQHGLYGEPIVAFDLDLKEGRNGIESFARLKERLGPLPDTWTQRTPSGGIHMIFRSQIWRKSSKDTLGPGIEVKAVGTYIMAPGSVFSGTEYKKFGGHDEIAWLPEAWEVALEPQRKGSRNGEIACGEIDHPGHVERAASFLQYVEPAVEGQHGDDHTVQTAMRVRDYGISEPVCLDLMETHFNPRCFPPWQSAHLERKVESAYRSAQNPIGILSADADFEPVAADDPLRSIPPRIESSSAFPMLSAASFAGKPIPEREWIVENVLPRRQVVALTGEGGGGKSELALQLCVAVAVNSPWLDIPTATGSVLYVNAEDEPDEIIRRLSSIADEMFLDLGDLQALHLIPLVEIDPTLVVPDRKTNLLLETASWSSLINRVQEVRPVLLVLDTQADFFGGDEVNRAQVRRFVSALRALSVRMNLTTMLISQPSLTGLRDGTGTSGSTAWHNSVRARLYLEFVRDSSGAEIDPDLRTLRSMKNNFGPRGLHLQLRRVRGFYRVETADGVDRATEAAEAQRVFLECLRDFQRQGRTVSPKPSGSYAPAVFSKMPGVRFGKSQLATAMENLFRAGRIRVEQSGPPSKRSAIILEIAG